MVVERKIDDLNRVVYGFGVMSGYSSEIPIAFDSYEVQHRASKRHGWVATEKWYRLDRRRSTIAFPPDVPQDVYDELVSLIKFKPQFNVQ